MQYIQKIYLSISYIIKYIRQHRVLFTLLSIFVLFVYFYWIFIYTTPDLRSIRGYYPNLTTEVYSSDGSLIGEYGINNRKLIPFNKIPNNVKHAFIAIEDKRFYEHKGIDLRSIFAAMLENIKAVDWVRGASTITQQVSKNLSLSFEKSITRKIKEAIIAYRMENYLTKDEILYIYLNHIYLADGVYGIESASQDYFGKSASDLNLAEAALLAGLPRRPEYYSPRKNLDRSIERQHVVLGKMFEQGYISRDELIKALSFKINIKTKERFTRDDAPYFIDMVKRFVKDKFGDKNFEKGGFKIFTSLDKDLNMEARWSILRGLMEINKRHNNGVVIKNFTGGEQMNNYLISQNIKDLELGNEYKGIVLNVRNIGNELYTATLGIGLRKAEIIFSTGRNYQNTIKLIENNVEDQYPFIDSYDDVTIIPYMLKKGDIVNVKITAAKDNLYFCKLIFNSDIQGALISIDRNGFIKSVVGGYDFSKSQFNRALQAHRQPGSVFKPIVYSAALDKGYTQLSILSDTAVSVGGWKPSNYDNRYLGQISLRQALVNSRNLATVNLIQDITPGYVVKYADKFGFTSKLDPYPSLALGSSVVTVEEMARAFSVFANGGRLYEPKFIYRVYDRNDNLLYNNIEISKKFMSAKLMKNYKEVTSKDFIKILQYNDIEKTYIKNIKQSIPEDTAYIMTDLLKGVIADGTGKRAKSLNRISPVAGKTGTTNNYSDAWFAGYSPYLTTVVWVGRDDNRSMGSGEAGSRAALPIWFDYMADALVKYPHTGFSKPADIELVSSPVGRVALKIDGRRERFSQPSYKLYRIEPDNNKTRKTIRQKKDLKQILKDAFLLPNP